jgi:hypothetical protein
MTRAGFYGGSQQYKGCLDRLLHRGREDPSWGSPDEFALKNIAESGRSFRRDGLRTAEDAELRMLS